MNHWRKRSIAGTFSGSLGRTARLLAPYVVITAVLGLAGGPLLQLAGADDLQLPTDPTSSQQAPTDDSTTGETAPSTTAPTTPTTAPATTAPTPPTTTAPTTTAPTTTAPTTTAPTTPTTAAAPAPALPPDDDGVLPGIENGAPNGGDGNADGTLDSDQANVASLPSKYDVDANGALDDYITIESPLFTALASVRTLEVPADNPPPDGVELPAGLIDYDVHVITPGDNADVKLYLPAGVQTSVYMLQSGNWTNFDDHSAINDLADEVLLNLADGGAGDESGTDGVIHDPVGVATPPAALGSFTVQNETLPEPGVTFTYTVHDCGTSGNPAAIGSCGPVLQTSAALGDGASHTFTGLQTNNHWYRVQQSTQAGWTLTSITCAGGSAQNNNDLTNRTGAVRLNLGAASGGACTFLNQQTASITVRKATSPSSAQPFSFSVFECTGGNGDNATISANDCDNEGVLVGSSFNLTNGNTNTLTTLGDTSDRWYRITEINPAGWQLTGRTCTSPGDAPPNTDNAPDSLYVRLGDGSPSTNQIVDCTFTNTQITAGVSGTITVRKTTSPASGQTFDFSVFQCTGGNGDNATVSVTDCDNEGQVVQGAFQLGNSGVHTIGLLPDTSDRWYRITETVPSGWDVSGRDCAAGPGDGSVDNGTNDSLYVRIDDNAATEQWADCTFTNTEQVPGSITIIKDVTPGTDAQDFSYTATGVTPTTFDLDDDGDNGNTLSNQILYDDLTPGTYTFTETVPAAWLVNGPVSCTGTSNETSIAGGNGVSVPLASGENVVCTFSNTAITPGTNGTISVTKQTTPNGNSQTFTMRLRRCGNGNDNGPCSGSDPFVLPDNQVTADNGSALWGPGAVDMTIPGRFEITESLPAGWVLTLATCTGGTGLQNVQTLSNGVRFHVQTNLNPGVQCTFNNAAPLPGTITARKSGFRDPGTNTLEGFSQPLEGATFEYRVSGSGDPWLPLCVVPPQTAPATGTCLSGPINPGIYDVRELAAPASWFEIPQASFPGGSGDVIPPAPYVSTVTVPSGGNVNTRWMVNRFQNPGIAQECGLDLALLIDRSGSIGVGDNEDAFEAAALSFISSLEGTPTRVKIYSFAETASTDQGTFLDLLNPADVATANSEITDIYQNQLGGGTNWDAGFQQVLGAGAEAVIIITDGNPTARVGDTGSTGTVNLEDIEFGVAAANSVKNTGQKVIAVGAGAQVSPTNLALISAPADTYTGSLAELQQVLEDLAEEFCAGSVTITKEELKDGVYVPAEHQWTFTANGAGLTNVAQQTNPSSTTFEFPDGQSGAVTIDESVLQGWTLNPQGAFNASCTESGDAFPVTNNGASGISFNLASTDIIACTFQNDPNAASIQVVKNTQTIAGGPFGFALSGGPTSKPPVNVTTNAADTDTPFAPAPAFGDLAAGTYAVSETQPAGWSPVSASCDNTTTGNPENTAPSSIPVAPGDAWVCTFVNTPNTASIKVVKTVVGGGAGTFSFDLTGTGGGPAGPLGDGGEFTWSPLAPGSSYTISETDANANGYALTNRDCVLTSGPAGGTVTPNGNGNDVTITPTAGQAYLCTYTNTRQATIKVVKSVVGGGAGTFSFDLTGTGGGPAGPLGDGGEFTWSPLAPGSSYTISETDANANGYALTNRVCVLDDGPGTEHVQNDANGNNATITPTAGQSYVCTYTNTRQATIKVVKSVVGGGAGTFSFDLTGAGGGPAGPLGDGGEFTWSPLAPGSSYTISETDANANGYALTNRVCVLDDGPGTEHVQNDANGNNATITPTAGQAYLCTYTNTRQASIKVVKSVVGGGAGTFNFNLTGDGGGPAGPLGDGGEFTWSPVKANTDHVISETNANTGEYDLLSRQCVLDPGSPAGGTVTPNENGNNVSINPAPGQSYTCTYVNTRESTIKVIKLVDGVQTADWTVDASAPAPPANISPDSVQTSATLTADFTLDHIGADGVSTTLTETLKDGYTAGAVSCTSPELPSQPGVEGSVDVSVLPGQTWTCTFNNSTNTATVRLIKMIGDAATPGWTINGGIDTPGSDPGRFTGPTAAPNGQTATGQTTNDANNPLVFTLTTVSNDGTVLDLSEVLQDGYTAGGVTCQADNQDAQTGPGTSVELEVNKGETWTCTWTNRPNTATVTVRKTIDDGPAVPGWTFDVATVAPATLSANQGTTGGVPAQASFSMSTVSNDGSPVTFTEHLQTGYSYDDTVCTKQGGANVPVTQGLAGTFTVNRGDVVVCTFNNSVNTATVKVVKHLGESTDAVPGWVIDGSIADPGTDPGRFSPGETATDQKTTNNSNATPVQFDLTTVSNDGTTVNFVEQLQDGYTAGAVLCTNGDDEQSGVNAGAVSLTVNKGETWTCVFTNTANEGSVEVLKRVDGVVTGQWSVGGSVPGGGSGRFAGGGTDVQGDTTGNEGAPLTFGLETVANDGTPVTLTETLKDGFSFVSLTCVVGETGVSVTPGNLGGTVTVNPGQTVRCTLNNTTNTATIKVIKRVGDTQVAGWTVNATDPSSPMQVAPGSVQTAADATADFALTQVAAGGSSVHLAEVLQDGFTAGNVSCTAEGEDAQTGTEGSVDVTVAPGETWTCTFNNTVNTGTIRVIKKVGDSQAAGWTVNASDPAAPAGITPSSVVTVADATVDFTLDHVVAAGSTTTLSEELQDGFTAGAVNCSAEGEDAQTGTEGSVDVTVAPGETWTCTFNNTVNTGTIRVIKKVGDSQAAGWTVDATDPTGPAGITPGQVVTVNPGTVDFTLDHVIAAGSTTTLSEVLQDGFSAGAVNCTAEGEDPQTGTAGSVDVSVAPGETWTCTFNNSVNTGTIKVIKKVDGTQVAGWTVNATDPAAPAGITPSSVVTVADATVDFTLDHVVAAGSTTTLSEELQDGFSAGAVNCTGPSAAQNGSSGSVAVTVKPGETWTCTFNNSVNTGTIKVIKKVDGTQVAGWTVNATDPAGSAGIAPGHVVTVNPGTVDFTLDHVVAAGSTTTLSEVLQDGFSAVDVSCTGPSAAQSGSSGSVAVTVKPGETWTCTFNNTQDPRIVVQKRLNGVLTGGWDYALSLGPVSVGTQPVFLPQGSTTVNLTTGTNGRVEQTISALPSLDPRVSVTIDETLKAGAEFVGVACTATIGGATVGRAVTAFDLATQSMTVEVRTGEVVVCTFDNTVVGVSTGTATRTGTGVGVSGIRAVLPFTGSTLEILLKTSLWFLAAGFFLIVAVRLSRRRVSTS